MFVQKSDIFLQLSKNQKSSLMSYIRNLSKKHWQKSVDEILNIFIEEETYYLEVKNPHFEWVIPHFEDDRFIKELKNLIKQYKLRQEEKDRQKPYIEKQKQYLKEQNKKLRDAKISREKPTPKQLKYYKNLCIKYNIEPTDTTNLSKLDLKNILSEIIEKFDKDAKRILIEKIHR